MPNTTIGCRGVDAGSASEPYFLDGLCPVCGGGPNDNCDWRCPVNAGQHEHESIVCSAADATGAAVPASEPTPLPDTTTYRDADGNLVSLDKLCRLEPEWAASRIRVMTRRLEELESILAAKTFEGQYRYPDARPVSPASQPETQRQGRRQNAADANRRR